MVSSLMQKMKTLRPACRSVFGFSSQPPPQRWERDNANVAKRRNEDCNSAVNLQMRSAISFSFLDFVLGSSAVLIALTREQRDRELRYLHCRFTNHDAIRDVAGAITQVARERGV